MPQLLQYFLMQQDNRIKLLLYFKQQQKTHSKLLHYLNLQQTTHLFNKLPSMMWPFARANGFIWIEEGGSLLHANFFQRHLRGTGFEIRIRIQTYPLPVVKSRYKSWILLTGLENRIRNLYKILPGLKSRNVASTLSHRLWKSITNHLLNIELNNLIP